ncbi:MAG: PAS-domain containing protein [Hyphomicrobiales bacterium]|nr:PAS-domain containing protein [Hyphomicrobiales bacterium]
MPAHKQTRFRKSLTASIGAAIIVCVASPALALTGLLENMNPGFVSELLVLSLLGGIVLACASAVILFHRSAMRANRAEARALDAIKELRQELDVAQSIALAEPQVLIAFGSDSPPRLVNHVLDLKFGVPLKLRSLLRFASWLERKAAINLETQLRQLQQTGANFEITIKTLTGALIEAEGRQSGSGYYLKLRDLASRRIEMANLLNKQRAMNEELASQRAVLDALPMPVWFRDPAGRLTWVNQAYVSAVEASKTENVIKEQRELLETRQRRAAEGALGSGETFRKRLQTVVAGERRTFDTIIVPVGRASAGTVIDVAPLEDVQEQLSRQMAAHEQTLNKVSTAVAVFSGDQHLVSCNDEFRKLWKIEEGWLGTRPQLGEFLDYLRQTRQLPEQSDYRAWRDAKIKRTDMNEPIEDWWYLPDGRTVHLFGDRRPDGGLIFLFDDVTEHLALESRYNSLIKVQRETLENLREGVTLFGSDGRLKLYNAAFAVMWRLDTPFLDRSPHIDDVRAKCDMLLDGHELWTTAMHAVTGVYETRESFDGSITRPDETSIAYAGVPLPDGSTVLTFLDISDSKKVETALIERNEALEAAEKMQNTFLSHVSYELRTPLTNIIGFSDMLAQPPVGPLAGKQMEYLNDIRTSSTKLLAIINDILDLTTIDAGGLELKLAFVPVRDIVEAAELGVRERLAKSGMTLAVQIADNLDAVFADRQRLTQVLYHLLSNAIGFSPESSTITITCQKSGAMVAFSIQDSGVGIPEEFQASVFGRFESRSHGSKHRGAGLGLAVVKSIVELHGGKILLRSSPGVGTTVTVLIPQDSNRIPQSDDEDRHDTSPPKAANDLCTPGFKKPPPPAFG